MPNRVFISYSSKDKNLADAICSRLEGDGIACWIAPRDIRPGVEWGAAIISGIEMCDVFLLLFTTNSGISKQVLREVDNAVNKGLTIVPVRMENIFPTGAMEYYLSAVHWLDAYSPPHEIHFEKVVAAVSRSLESKSVLEGSLPSGYSRPYSRETLSKSAV